MIKRLLLVLPILAALSHGQNLLRLLGTASATGAGTAVDLSAAVAVHKHTVVAIPTGSPAACTIKLEGSLDGTNWFDLSGGQTCTSAVMFHVVDKPVLKVRANVTALSGGTSPTVTVAYLGGAQ